MKPRKKINLCSALGATEDGRPWGNTSPITSSRRGHEPHHIIAQRLLGIFQKRALIHSLPCTPGRAPHPAQGLLESKGAVPFLLLHVPPLSPYPSGSLVPVLAHVLFSSLGPFRLALFLLPSVPATVRGPCHSRHLGTTTGSREIWRFEDVSLFW